MESYAQQGVTRAIQRRARINSIAGVIAAVATFTVAIAVLWFAPHVG